MRNFSKHVFYALFVCILCAPIALSAFTMRVLLTKEQYPQKSTFCNLKTKSGFVLEDVENSAIHGTIDTPVVSFGLKNGFVTANKNRYFLYEETDKTKLKATSRYVWAHPKKSDDLIEWNGQKYPGSILCICENDTFSIINVLDSEIYVMSVLYCESCIDWDIEVQKTFAIMVRTYLVFRVIESRTQAKAGTRKWYDIKCTNAHQTYRGIHNHPKLEKATQKTSGLIITWGKKPIDARYDICCGGVKPNLLEGVANFEKAPYLARTQACTFCSKAKAFSWETIYPQKMFEEKIRSEFPKKKARGNLVSVSVSRTDKAGAVKEITIKWQKDTLKISGKKMYSLFKKIKSSLYDAFLDDRGIHFVGKGFGHHLGLCQWGAKEMVRQGYSYRDVLAFYYPHTSLMRLEIVSPASERN